MSMYRCNRCENIFDQDLHGIEEDPTDNTQCVCENCYEDLTEDDTQKEFEYQWAQYKKEKESIK